MIIPTRILRAGLPAELPDAGSPERPERPERGVLAATKRLTIALLGAAAAAYGERVRDHQEILSHVADIIIDGYAIESALARTEKLAAHNAEAAPLAADMTAVFVCDASDRVVHAAKQVACALGEHGAATRAHIAVIAAYPGIDTIAARRRIAGAVLEAGQHPL
jgi:alkylation response protein AidB-like acyl-CoA dehydrogenase